MEVKNSICRICLEHVDSEESSNIYETRIDNGKLVYKCFEPLFSILVDAEDQLPNIICEKCKLSIELSMSLRNQAIESDKILRKNKSEEDSESTQIIIIKPEDTEEGEGEEYLVDVDNSSRGNDQITYEPEMDQSNDENDEHDDECDDAVAFLLGKVNNNKSNSKSAPESNAERKYTCTVCDKRFLKRTNLIDHLKIHANVKSYSCTYCEKAFTQYGNLKAHIRSHTKQKPYECKICQKAYTQSSALKIHMRTHTNQRDYICNVCGKGFTNASDLGKHKKIHDPEKDYECKECQQQFTQKAHAKKHIRKIHPYADIEKLLVKRR
uniref:CSON000767 protein n=1 Tax=Culicoides sonorensis TaxID=179676 RepID=A0A336MGD8_CULSO